MANSLRGTKPVAKGFTQKMRILWPCFHTSSEATVFRILCLLQHWRTCKQLPSALKTPSSTVSLKRYLHEATWRLCCSAMLSSHKSSWQWLIVKEWRESIGFVDQHNSVRICWANYYNDEEADIDRMLLRPGYTRR